MFNFQLSASVSVCFFLLSIRNIFSVLNIWVAIPIFATPLYSVFFCRVISNTWMSSEFRFQRILCLLIGPDCHCNRLLAWNKKNSAFFITKSPNKWEFFSKRPIEFFPSSKWCCYCNVYAANGFFISAHISIEFTAIARKIWMLDEPSRINGDTEHWRVLAIPC